MSIYAICATSTQGVLLNNLYYYPAKQCLFNQPATLITSAPISQAGRCNDVAGSGTSCQDPFALTGLKVEEVDLRPGHAVFDFSGSDFNPLTGGLPSTLPVNEVPIQTVEDGTDVSVLFTRDYNIHATDASHEPIHYEGGVIRVFYIAYYDADQLLGMPNSPLIQVRGIGQELPSKSGNPSDQYQLQIVFLDSGGYYCDCNLIAGEGGPFSTMPHDVFTKTRISK